MSLFIITLLNALSLIALGAAFIWGGAKWEGLAKAFPRSKVATLVTLGLGTAGFLYHITQLGEADYGNYKQYLLIGFTAVAVLSYFWVPDFLSVRGLTVIGLLLAKVNLDAAYMLWDIPQRLFLVSFSYLLIFLCLYLAVSPFRVRDFLNWAYQKAARPKAFGSALSVIGILLGIVAFTY